MTKLLIFGPLSQSSSGGVTKQSKEAERLSRVVNAEQLSGAEADWSQDNDREVKIRDQAVRGTRKVAEASRRRRVIGGSVIDDGGQVDQ
ncbi:MAG: hypothetical protein NXY57DRAFT_969115 [Lentinula lateritia]|nr:MAG: hypothetical protein NXY57DRAFT_969115 [Lentinula lateritia]